MADNWFPLLAIAHVIGGEWPELAREAAKTLKGRELIAVINSIGVRRDSGAIPLLKERLKDQNPQVVSASAASLGKIGGPEATATLQQALGSFCVAI